MEGPQRRIPNVWLQRVEEAAERPSLTESDSDTAVIVEVEDLEIREGRVEILDSYTDMRLVALIEVVSPTNNGAGTGLVQVRAEGHAGARVASGRRSTYSDVAVTRSPSPSGESSPLSHSIRCAA